MIAYPVVAPSDSEYILAFDADSGDRYATRSPTPRADHRALPRPTEPGEPRFVADNGLGDLPRTPQQRATGMPTPGAI